MPNLDEVLREAVRSVVEMGQAELQQAARDGSPDEEGKQHHGEIGRHRCGD